MKANNLPDMQFRVMIIRLLNSMREDIETFKKGQSENKNAISEINNTLEGIYSTLIVVEVEDQISNLKDKVEKNTQAEQQKENRNFFK